MTLGNTFRTALRSKKAPVPINHPPGVWGRVPRAELPRTGPASYAKYIGAHLAGSIAVHLSVEYLRESEPIQAIYSEGKRKLKEDAKRGLERFEKSAQDAVRRNLEDNAKKRLNNFEKLLHILRIYRRRP